MKKILIRLCSVAAIGLALTACNNDAANKTAMDADNSSVDQMVQDKIKTLDDSLAKVCDDQVTLAANAKIEAEASKGGTAHTTTHHTTTPATPAKKDEPKPSTVGNGKPNMNGNQAPGTVGNGKPNMNGSSGPTGKSGNTVGNGKPKM